MYLKLPLNKKSPIQLNYNIYKKKKCWGGDIAKKIKKIFSGLGVQKWNSSGSLSICLLRWPDFL